MSSAENPDEPLHAPTEKGALTAERNGLPAISPDEVEQDDLEEINNIVPTRGYQLLPMVALGGSAGSIGALQQFFAAMPAESGMAFVVILHLSPEHESTLPELLARTTSMRVTPAANGEKVEANTVYVIPPGKHLTSTDGHLKLTDLQPAHGKRVTVDVFFRTLADTHGPHSAAIVLSGADGDGAIGIKRIKERGGLTIAQDPEEAEHPSMPRSAIDTGMVDWVLEVAQMPARLLEYQAQEHRLKLPSEEGPQPATPVAVPPTDDEKALRDVLTFLRARTGRDFSYYKRATIVRRVSRRMQINAAETLPAYLDFMRTHPGEAGALLQDLLISVTNFFRDRDCFEALKREIPAIMAAKKPEEPVRVWVAACATGEEAYSIAILLHEYADAKGVAPLVQVFATDLDEEVIATAREGLFPATISADVSEERLRRFFIKEHRGYRLRREIRESVLFAVHDLLKDAPFSRLDLASCRNLLIYLTREAQARAMDIFHFALRPGGRLFLGSSESVEEDHAQFQVLDKKHRLYVQIPLARTGLPLPIGPGTLQRAMAAQDRRGGVYVHGAAFARVTERSAQQQSEFDDQQRVSWEELHFKLIERFAPPSLIVNRDYEIVHVSENAGRFLHFAGGEPSVNLLKVVHPMLRVELRAALFRAAQAGTPVEVFRLPVEMDDRSQLVDLRVAPAQEIAPDYLLVVFSLRDPAESGEAGQARVEAEPAVRHLERELEQMKTRLRDTVEQYDASTEELKASNEELQAMNEELRSATEELETSREELQSINEELSTVNQELKSNVDELGHTNGDLINLMAAIAVPTIFLDRQLRITRYTPAALELFRLIPSDLGRPLGDLTHRLAYPELASDAQQVLDSLVPVRREIRADDRWFLAQLLPYRTTDDHIGGTVLTFVDISELRTADVALHQATAEKAAQLRTFHAVLDSALDFIYYFDLEGRLTFANQPLLALWQLPLEEVVGKNFHDLNYPRELADRLHSELREVVTRPCAMRGQTPYTSAFGTRHYEYIFTPLIAADGSVEAVAGITRDITDQMEVDAALRVSTEQLRLVVENAREYAIFSADLKGVVTVWNIGAEHILGYTEKEIVGQNAEIIYTPEDRAKGVAAEEMRTALQEGRAEDERWHLRKDGSRFWGSGFLMRMDDSSGAAIGFVKILRDNTAAREAQHALEESREQLWEAVRENERARAEVEAASQAKDHFLAVLSHELRTPLTPVLMAVSTIARRKDLPPAVGEALTMIERNVKIEAHFIDDLLDLTKITRGKLELVCEPLDLHEALRHALEISRPDIDAKRLELSVALDATEHAYIGDTTRLQQVFWNLLKNAAKFTPEGGAIRLVTRNEPDCWICELSDSGIGFLPEQAALIFDAFAQANRAITREYGGLGLGLAISLATVHGHGGTLRAESGGPGTGATFIVNLPLNQPCDDRE